MKLISLINSLYKNCYKNIPDYLLSDSIINSSFSESINEMDSINNFEIKNKTEIINAIIDNFINKFNILDINNGNDIKMSEQN